MKMIFRWFPNGDDSVTLDQIRQIPGVSGVAACMPHIPVGEVWQQDDILAMRREINDHGLEMEVIESVNIHEDIKKGLPSRDRLIENYITTVRNLHNAGVRCICYNFMPVMDWARSDLARPIEDGSTVMSYHHADLDGLDPAAIGDSMHSEARGFSLPGWERERMPQMSADICFYREMPVECYWDNIRYFLDAVMPYADMYDMKFAIHPDDPPWQLFGLPKVITNADSIRKFLGLNNSSRNGLTLCTGSLGANGDNDVPSMIREFASQGRVHFAHLRNIKRTPPRDFHETAHLSACGDLDMFEIVRALHDSGFDGYIRPDHGRMIWGEQARPGYGLYDRALGVEYILGLWEACEKFSR
ncbi:MAG: mannonate dehydratase [Ruminococcaceae bacterium]|nr:mannonate dehydratase [Oscillospiraceae bacterium]